MNLSPELARLYAKRLAQPVISATAPRPSRLQEYKEAWQDEELSWEGLKELAASTFPDGISDWLAKLRDILLATNPDLPRTLTEAPIVEIKSYEQCTAAKVFEKERPVIVVDSGLLVYVWRMNKAYLYGQDSGFQSTRLLVAMTIAHHAAQIEPPAWAKGIKNVETIFPPPPTPGHSDPALFTSLLGLTVEHESFILAHEIAHIELGHLGDAGYASRPPNSRDLHPTVGTFMPNGLDRRALQEFDADARALRICANAFGKDSAYSQEGCLMMLFQLSRYLLWLELALRESKCRGEEFLWAARHFRLRQEIESYAPEMHSATVRHLEWLEDNMEEGAFAGVEIYREILNSPPPSGRGSEAASAG